MTKVLMTREQYNSLSPIGVELHRYWMTFNPEIYKKYVEAGTLLEILQSEENKLDRMVVNLIQSGLTENLAKEVAIAEIHNEIKGYV